MAFASDRPHPTERSTEPDDAQLIDLLTERVPDAATRNTILGWNPEALYGFAPA